MPFIFEIDHGDGGRSESLLLFLGRYYRLADGSTQMIDEQAAWCTRCRRVIAAEQLRPLPELERKLAELQQGDKPLLDLLSALFGSVEEEIVNIRNKLEWRQRRTSSARCLNCGSEDIVPLPFEGETVHPGNGRTIRVRCENRCDALRLDAYYSTEGIRIVEPAAPAE
jgi:hypothetical protein